MERREKGSGDRWRGFSMSDAFEKCAQKVENWKVSNGDVGDASRKDMRVHY